MRHKILITFGVLFGLLVLILLGAYFFTQTEYFRNLAKRTAERIVNSSTGQKLTIGSVEGTFFYSLKLKDVAFTVENENFVRAEEIDLVYSIPAMLNSAFLFSKTVPVDGLSITGADVDLIKYADGTWNFEKIGTKKEKDRQKDKEPGAPPGWNIIAREVLLDNAKLTLENRESGKVSEYLLNKTELSARLTHIYEKIEVDLKNADLDAVSEGISVRGLSTKGFYSEDEAEVGGLKVTLNGARIEADVEADNLKSKPEVSFDISAEGYELKDIGTISLETKGKGSYAGPGDIRGDLSIEIPEAKLYGNKLSGSLDAINISGTKIDLGKGRITAGPGTLELSGIADIRRLITKEGDNSFKLSVNLRDVKTAEVFSILEKETHTKTEGINTNLDAVLNAGIDAEGKWVEFGDLTAHARIKNLDIKGNKAGELKLSGTVDYSRERLGLDVKTALNKLNPGVITNKQQFKGSVTSDLSIKGSMPLEGDLLQGMKGNVKGNIKPSSIFNVNIKKGNIDVSYDKEILTARALSIDGDKFKLGVTDGKGSRKGVNFGYDLVVEDLGLISTFAPGTEFEGTLKAKGRVEGPINNPKITINAEADGFEMNKEISAESITIEGDGTPNLRNPNMRLEMKADTIKVKEREFQNLEVTAASEGSGINVDAEITENDDNSYEISTTLTNLGEREKNIEISKILLDIADTELENRETIFLTVAPNKIIIKSFNLYYGDSSATADADITYNGRVDANINLNDLSLNELVKIADPKSEVDGNLSAIVSASGTMSEPVLSAKLDMEDIVYKDFKNDDVAFDLSYSDQNLRLKLDITNAGASVMQANGTSNLDLDLNNLDESFKNGSFNLTVVSSGVDLSPLTTFSSEIEKSPGKLVVDLTASGTFETPSVNGQMSLNDATFKIKSLRNEFTIVSALIEMQGQKGFLRDMQIHSGSSGTGQFTGDIDIPTFTYNLTGDLKNFLVRPKNVSGLLSGNLTLKGEGIKMDIGGRVTVSRGRITIPEHEEKQIEEIKFADEEEDEFMVGSGERTDYFKENIALKLRVRMRRNNWVRGRGANIELRGDLDLNKEFGRPVRIVGNISTIRGTYETFGKLFRIVQGNVSFSGTEDINPFLDIRAMYRVSGVQIYVNISGTAEKPVVELTSDPPMSETDMVSYVVFGASSDKISSGDRASIQGVASGLAGGIAAAQLEKVLGDKFKLDVVSIGAGTGGPQVEVGKYLTEDLYIAFDRETSQSLADSTAITQTKVLIEYTIFKNVTLSGDVGGENPGVDVFYNFNY